MFRCGNIPTFRYNLNQVKWSFRKFTWVSNLNPVYFAIWGRCSVVVLINYDISKWHEHRKTDKIWKKKTIEHFLFGIESYDVERCHVEMNDVRVETTWTLRKYPLNTQASTVEKVDLYLIRRLKVNGQKLKQMCFLKSYK